MREWFTIACTIVALLMAGGAAAQETRGTISGTVRDKDVVASAVLLDTNAVSSGLTFENRLITELPTFSSMPLLLKIDQGAQS